MTKHMRGFVPGASFSDDTLGGRLSAARDAAGIDAAALANQLGVRAQTLAAWESDRSEPRPSRLVNLAGILGVSPMWLMTGVGDGPQDRSEGLPIEAMRNQLLRLNELHQEYGRLIEGLMRRIESFEQTRRADEQML